MKIELKKLRYVYPSGDEALKGIIWRLKERIRSRS